MQSEDITVGKLFSWKPANGGETSNAVVTSVRSDQQEGLSTETEAYAALWIEANSNPGDNSSKHAFTIMLGTDGKSYVDGKEVLITLRP